MSHPSSRHAQAIALALVAAASMLFAQCGKSTPTTPTSTTPTITAATGAVSTAALFKKGATAQMTVTGTMSSGGTQDVTSQCTGWTSDNGSVATVSASGLVTAQNSGSATIVATCGTVQVRLVVTLTVALKAAPSVTLSSVSMGTSIYAPLLPQVVFKVVYSETSKAFGYNVNFTNFTVRNSAGSTLSHEDFGTDIFVSGSRTGWKAGDAYMWPAWGTNHIDAGGSKYACFVSASFSPMPSSAPFTWATQITDEVGTVVDYGSSTTLAVNPVAYSCDETHGIAANRFVFPMPSQSGR